MLRLIASSLTTLLVALLCKSASASLQSKVEGRFAPALERALAEEREAIANETGARSGLICGGKRKNRYYFVYIRGHPQIE